MKWLVQDTMRSDALVLEEICALRSIGQEVCNLGYIPFTNHFTNLQDYLFDPNEPFCLRGSVKFVNMISSAKSMADLLPEVLQGRYEEYFTSMMTSIFYTPERFSQQNTQHLPMLNHGRFVPFSGAKDMLWSSDQFIKPASDLKAFAATVVPVGQTLDQALSFQNVGDIDPDELVLITDVKQVELELRLFVVEGQIVTGSQYHVNDRIDVKPLNQSADHQTLIAFGKEMVAEYEPDQFAYTLDVCLHNGKPAIVEYNCFNASGLYKSDAKLLFGAVAEVYRGY